VLEYPAASEVRAERSKLMLARQPGQGRHRSRFHRSWSICAGESFCLLCGVRQRFSSSEWRRPREFPRRIPPSSFGFSYATTEYERILGDEKTTCVFARPGTIHTARLAVEALNMGKASLLKNHWP
jgi:hypothetical protein